jgi:hypothetical protein
VDGMKRDGSRILKQREKRGSEKGSRKGLSKADGQAYDFLT